MYKGFIYLATSPKGKKYYGQTTSSLERRKKCHREDAFIRNLQGSFQRALRKYGFENFEWKIIEEYQLEEKIDLIKILNLRELFWIQKDKTYLPKFGYNMKIGPSCGFHNDECKEKIRNSLLGVKHTSERRKNQSLSHIGQIPWNKNKKCSQFAGSNNPSYKIIPIEDEEKILDLYSKGFGSRVIERELENKYSFIKILKFLRSKGVWHPHKFDRNVNKNKIIKEELTLKFN
ncbi:MAG TPA: GIY-YIG nuclease family protein [Candidatus Paceibacterota bacterium]|jgi:group I intron endonuclease|nr:GIY-YIG nuclease family protein [Candidatus Paceibacterota bacterium]